nr:uncharacterized protein LOC127326404 [Lolium perenne]
MQRQFWNKFRHILSSAGRNRRRPVAPAISRHRRPLHKHPGPRRRRLSVDPRSQRLLHHVRPAETHVRCRFLPRRSPSIARVVLVVIYFDPCVPRCYASLSDRVIFDSCLVQRSTVSEPSQHLNFRSTDVAPEVGSFVHESKLNQHRQSSMVARALNSF